MTRAEEIAFIIEMRDMCIALHSEDEPCDGCELTWNNCLRKSFAMMIRDLDLREVEEGPHGADGV
jgi:hypothetical protein